MVRAPCCEKMGLKKGPWTQEEDQILIAYIKKYGHGNWRALPKQAGLLRCGKSCRLRWTNYLRPDIKRGNFSREEEEKIISLHEMLGNRWSAIAAQLPGRTDNEIKNVWHTHLKKRVTNSNQTVTKCSAKSESKCTPNAPAMNHKRFDQEVAVSPARSYSDASSSDITRESNGSAGMKEESMESLEGFPEIDESFWSDALPMDNLTCSSTAVLSDISPFDDSFCDPNGDEMSFWLKVFLETGDSLELPEI